MKKFIKLYVLLLFLVNILCIYFFNNDYDFFGLIDFDDFLTGFNISFFIIVEVLLKNFSNKKYIFSKYILFLILLCIFSSFQAYLLYNQNLFMTLLSQKELISISLLYFPLIKIVKNDIININDFNKLVDKFAIIQLFLFISQYLLSGKISFLVVTTAERYGDIRYYFNPILLDLFLIKNLNEFVHNNGKRKLKSILFICLILFETMVVQKYRLTSVGLIIIIIFGLLISKTNLINKIKSVFVGVIFSVYMLNTRIVQDIISEFTVKSKTFTYSIRETGRKLYLDMISKHPILGGGYPKSELALYTSGYYDKIFLSDNGIFGFMYVYGLLGLIWYILLWIKLLKGGYEILKKNGNIVYLLFPLFFIITCTNELHWYWQSGFMIFVIFLISIEQELHSIKK